MDKDDEVYTSPFMRRKLSKAARTRIVEEEGRDDWNPIAKNSRKIKALEAENDVRGLQAGIAQYYADNKTVVKRKFKGKPKRD